MRAFAVPDAVRRYTVRLSPAASTDMLDIARYIADERGIDAAEGFLDSMMERVGTLEHFPLRGAAPKELTAQGRIGFRQIIFGLYRIIYTVLDDTVAVLLIADGRRDMPTLLRERLLRGPTSD